MPNDPDDRFCYYTVVVLRADRMVREREDHRAVPVDLSALFLDAGTYMTLQLGRGLEVHYDPDSGEDPNSVVTGLVRALGHTGTTVRGTAHFTGDSAETDSAPGMDPQAYESLFECLAEICVEQQTRLWRQYRPDDIVMVRPTDYAQGDNLWFGGWPHRFVRLLDYPADSGTAKMFPGVQYFECEDGFTMGASGSSYPERADRAPAGYWQRTGDQLLPAQG